MGLRLKITVRTERTVVGLKSRTLSRWCEICACESEFVDETAEASDLVKFSKSAPKPHWIQIEGREHLCLRSITTEK